MTYKNLISSSLACFLLITLVGCDSSDAQFSRVEGVVTYNGEPVDGATITFIAMAPGGISGAGTTDVRGSFTLTSSGATRGGSGVQPGEYQVTIRKQEFPVDPDSAAYDRGEIDYDELQRRLSARGSLASAGRPIDLLPARYSQPGGSGFTVTVTTGRNQPFSFDLTD